MLLLLLHMLQVLLRVLWLVGAGRCMALLGRGRGQQDMRLLLLLLLQARRAERSGLLQGPILRRLVQLLVLLVFVPIRPTAGRAPFYPRNDGRCGRSHRLHAVLS